MKDENGASMVSRRRRYADRGGEKKLATRGKLAIEMEMECLDSSEDSGEDWKRRGKESRREESMEVQTGGGQSPGGF